MMFIWRSGGHLKKSGSSQEVGVEPPVPPAIRALHSYGDSMEHFRFHH